MQHQLLLSSAAVRASQQTPADHGGFLRPSPRSFSPASLSASVSGAAGCASDRYACSATEAGAAIRQAVKRSCEAWERQCDHGRYHGQVARVGREQGR